MDGGHQENNNSGPGQAVNVHIGFGPAVVLVVALVVLIGLLFFSTRSAARAEMKAEAAEGAAKTYAAELRMTQFWMTRVSATCAASGMNTPPIPANLIRN